jgi:carbon monoxide dehydrogenase subunit G
MELTNEFEVAVPIEEAWTVLTDVERIAPCLPGAELQEVEGDQYRGIVKVKVGPITASYKGSARFEEMDAIAHRAVLKAEGRETRGQGNASATISATLSPSGDGTKVEVVTDLAITGKVAQFGRGVLADVSGKLLDQFVHNLETMVLTPALAASASSSDESGADADGTADAAPQAQAGEAAAPKPTAAKSNTPKPTAAKSNTPKPTAARRGSITASAVDDDEAEVETPAPAIRQIQSDPADPVDLGRIAGPSLAKRLIPFASVAGGLFLIRVIVYALRRRKK